jgi:hypothetical protein
LMAEDRDGPSVPKKRAKTLAGQMQKEIARRLKGDDLALTGSKLGGKYADSVRAVYEDIEALLAQPQLTEQDKDDATIDLLIKSAFAEIDALHAAVPERVDVQQQPQVPTQVAPVAQETVQEEGQIRPEEVIIPPTQPQQVANEQSERPQAQSGTQTETYGDPPLGGQAETVETAGAPVTAPTVEPGAVENVAEQQGDVAPVEVQARDEDPGPVVYDERLNGVSVSYNGANGDTIDAYPLPILKDLDDRLEAIRKLVKCIG